MSENDLTGIFFYHPGDGNVSNLDFKELMQFSGTFKHVAVVWDSEKFPLWDKKYLESQIRRFNLVRLIIAGYDTGMIKPFFATAFSTLGIPVENILLADFMEHGAMEKSNAELAKAIVVCSIYNVPFEDAAKPGESDVCPDTLVIGGGIAGIEASLEIADGNQKVYLVEKTGTIGGHMAMFDKTFPTLDCAACILTPKMVDVGQHPYIDLMTYSEVKSIEGHPGCYKAKILKKARRVDLSKCIGCGTCAEKCPGKTYSEFDQGTVLRTAIYRSFPQAVPNKYLIDAESCRYVQGEKCGVCVKVCPVPDCIDLDAKDEEVEITIGNIIVATGFKVFDAKRAGQFGYGKYPNVLTSLEFERLINAAGPTGGNITYRNKDKKGNWVFTTGADVPDSVAIIHCIGSRDENYNAYCSKVCCMYSLKLAHLVKEKLPGAEVYEHYIDMRAFGKGYEEFYERIKREGIHIIRGRTATVKSTNGELIIRSEDIESGRLLDQKVEMVILAVGMEPTDDARSLAGMMGIEVDKYGWMCGINNISDSVNTRSGGVAIAGTCQGPKDIPDTVVQASAAASRVLQNIIKGKASNGISSLSYSDIEKRAKELSTIKEM
ncbi:MAG: CoB--CoM heterodisulfide reductase iron-sulfur subunit A family protein [Bacteroidetes bacterium]|nr:CoB--CoM heterodisulfide reductase iron-sulfur subunit A family protein [Bacteroidota bacterium]